MHFLQRVLVVACTTPLAATLAQPAQEPSTTPAATVAPAYRSVFENYRPWSAADPGRDWRTANQEMGQLGGHAGHLRAGRATPSSAQPHDPPKTQPGEPGDRSTAPGGPPHDAHRKMHGAGNSNGTQTEKVETHR